MKGSCAAFRSCWRAASSSGTHLVQALIGTPPSSDVMFGSSTCARRDGRSGSSFENSVVFDDERLLTSAYQSCLDLAEQHQLKSIAFPSLSTGIYGYPLELAAPIALRTIIEHIEKPTCLQQVLMVLCGEHAYTVHEQALGKLV